MTSNNATSTPYNSSLLSRLAFIVATLVGSISFVITAINWVSPQLFASLGIDINAFLEIATVFAVLLFLTGIWLELHRLLHKLGGFHEQIKGTLDTFSNDIKADTNTGREIKNSLESSGLLARETVQLKSPHKKEEFKKIFQNAIQISAYNPPLNLLIDSEDHRSIITDIFNREDLRYRVIAGPTCKERLEEFKEKWKADLTKKSMDADAIKQCFSQMEIMIYEHTEDLHSTVSPWIEIENDVRGLCFFLIDYDGRKAVLMYILGRPLMESFNAPSTAVLIERLIESPEEKFLLYDSMEEEYERKWNSLHDKFNQNNVEVMHTNLDNL